MNNCGKLATKLYAGWANHAKRLLEVDILNIAHNEEED